MRSIRTTIVSLALIAALAPALSGAQTPGGGTPVKLKSARVTAINNDEANKIISIAYREHGRLVYDPLVITPDTAIFVRGKPANIKAIRLRQYLIVAALQQGDELVAQRIDIGAPPKIVVKAKPKVVAKKPKSIPTVNTALTSPKH